MEKKKLIVILGPTASGKSDVAVKLAKKFGGEIISADSRQVYKGLSIGTGKITRKEMNGVNHHLLDVVSPQKRFTVSDFKKLAEKAINEIADKNRVPIICGGTGFYIDAILGEKQIPEVLPNPKLRKESEKKSPKELFEILKKLDPERAQNIDAKNPRRLVRAIEIAKALGKVPTLHQDPAEQTKYNILKIGIAPITPSPIDEKELKERINKRIDKWFKMGLLKEVGNLHKKGLSWKRMSEIGLEYKTVSLFLRGKISKSEMIERMQKETWQYAKRQMTWFRKTKNVIWFIPSKVEGFPPKACLVEKEVKNFI